MDVDKNEMPQHDAHRRLGLAFQEIEQNWHAVAHRFAGWRDVHRAPNVDRPASDSRLGRQPG